MTNYLLQVTVCWLLFYALYWMVLSRETFFQLNRGYLLATLLLGLLIPLIQLPEWPVGKTSESIGYYLEEVTVTAQNLGVTLEEVVVTAETKASELSLTNVLMIFYWLGVASFGLLFLGGIWRIQRLRRYAIIQTYEEYQLVNTQEVHLPFSFFRWLFWNDSTKWTEEERTAILRHELEHIRGHHSWDVLFLEILKIFFWFCPAIYLYKRSVRNVHEYLADSAVLQNTRKKQYGRLLLRQVQHQAQPALANHFIHSQLKKRIKMMIRNKSRRSSLYKYAFILPIAALLLMAFSSRHTLTNNFIKDGFITEAISSNPGFDKDKVRQRLNATLDKYQPENSELELERMLKELSEIYFSLQKDYPNNKGDIRSITRQFFKDNKLPFKVHQKDGGDRLIVLLDVPNHDEIDQAQNPTEIKAFKKVDQMPRFPGCESKGLSGEELKHCAKKELLSYIYSQIKYPAKARNEGTEGTVVTRFIIDIEGRIRDAEIVKSIGNGCDEEVLRVVNSMNEMAKPWTPGEQDNKKVPVYFNLPVKFKLAAPSSDLEVKEQLDELSKNIEPIYYLNGVKVDRETIHKLDMDDIGTIDVLKGDKAVEKFGEEARQGVVNVTSKNPIYDKVDQMPRFPGCEDADMSDAERKKCSFNKLVTYLGENMKYPELAKKNQVEGIVVIGFVVDKNGQIQKPEIKRSIGSGCDEEVMRIVEKMQESPERWTPGVKDDKAVNVHFHLPVKFKLEGSEKEEANKKYPAPAFSSLALDRFKAFPNPSDGKINLRFEAPEVATLIRVVDNNGREVYRQEIKDFGGRFNEEIDLSQAPKGSLFLNIIQGDKGFTKTIIVE